MKNNIIPLLSRVARLFTGGNWLPGKELPFNGASFTTNMKDVEGRAQDKTRPIPTLNNGCYEIFVFPSRCFLYPVQSCTAPLFVGAQLCSSPAPSLPRAHLWGDHENVLPAEDPQGTRGAITHPCDFPGAAPPKSTHSAWCDTGMAPSPCGI